ncbi:hypothetical protein [Paenibacillus chitinolyticus]
MKVEQVVSLIEKVGPRAQEVRELMQQITASIGKMEHPVGAGQFLLFDEKKGNGVKPIKENFMLDLLNYGGLLEHRVDVGVTNTKPGPIDAVFPMGNQLFAVEWETGNISSSHRAINKIVTGIITRQLIGGVLILPSRKMYDYLTDRIGNFRELAPYFNVWQQANYDIDEGYLYVMEIEHDGLTDDSRYRISKGTDGRALI